MVEADTRSFIEGKLKEFKDLANFSENGWKLEEKEKNMTIYKRESKEEPKFMMGCSTSVELEPKKLVEILLNDTYMLEIDDSKVFRKTFRSEKLDDKNSLYFLYQKGKGKLMVDPRDFVTCAIVSESGDDIFLVSASIEDKDHPAEKGFVRGHLVMQGWKISKNGSSSDIILALQMDPRGSIPSAMITVGMKKGLALPDKICQYAKKKKL